MDGVGNLIDGVDHPMNKDWWPIGGPKNLTVGVRNLIFGVPDPKNR